MERLHISKPSDIAFSVAMTFTVLPGALFLVGLTHFGESGPGKVIADAMIMAAAVFMMLGIYSFYRFYTRVRPFDDLTEIDDDDYHRIDKFVRENTCCRRPLNRWMKGNCTITYDKVEDLCETLNTAALDAARTRVQANA